MAMSLLFADMTGHRRMTADALKVAMGHVASARAATEARNHEEATSEYDVCIRLLQDIVQSASESKRKRVLETIEKIEKEKQSVRTHERSDKMLIDCWTHRVENSPDVPPSDPGVWPDPPPKRTSAATTRNLRNQKPSPTTAKGRSVDDDKKMRKSSSQSGLNRNKVGSSSETPKSASDKAEENSSDKEFQCTVYDQALVDTIRHTMEKFVEGDSVRVGWDDIAGLDSVKDLFKQAIILPSLMPRFFTGIRRPCRGVCMVGPPGTGKTLLAKAVATECKTTFFAVNCGDLSSKWRGDSEKLITILFEMARFYAPSTIFIDEIDSIGGQRGGENEHEASRRLKSQLLTEMDGFGTGDDSKRVLVIAATNFPWQLDEALRRRFEKRVYIPLPDPVTRLALLKLSLKDLPVTQDVDLESVAESMDGYSGADIVAFCRKAAVLGMERLTKNMTTIELEEWAKDSSQLELPITMDDLTEALKSVKPTVSEDSLQRYSEWIERYGSR